ncbi:MAG: Lsr2 family protein [Microbacterium sp.]|nr:Lsr2 family protein [Microbacterium sp.]
MTRETRTVLVDDLDGSEAHHTITFAYLDRRYEIDLSTDNAETFFNLILPYIEAGRPARLDADKADAMPSRDLTKIRTWAREHGFAVSDRGRIAQRVRNAYDESERRASEGR